MFSLSSTFLCLLSFRVNESVVRLRPGPLPASIRVLFYFHFPFPLSLDFTELVLGVLSRHTAVVLDNDSKGYETLKTTNIVAVHVHPEPLLLTKFQFFPAHAILHVIPAPILCIIFSRTTRSPVLSQAQ
jgi:hypothetical protein